MQDPVIIVEKYSVWLIECDIWVLNLKLRKIQRSNGTLRANSVISTAPHNNIKYISRLVILSKAFVIRYEKVFKVCSYCLSTLSIEDVLLWNACMRKEKQIGALHHGLPCIYNSGVFHLLDGQDGTWEVRRPRAHRRIFSFHLRPF